MRNLRRSMSRMQFQTVQCYKIKPGSNAFRFVFYQIMNVDVDKSTIILYNVIELSTLIVEV